MGKKQFKVYGISGDTVTVITGINSVTFENADQNHHTYKLETDDGFHRVKVPVKNFVISTFYPKAR